MPILRGRNRYALVSKEKRREWHWASNKWRVNPSYNAKIPFSPSSLPTKLTTAFNSTPKNPPPSKRKKKMHKH